jgi:hypothetical protein
LKKGLRATQWHSCGSQHAGSDLQLRPDQRWWTKNFDITHVALSPPNVGKCWEDGGIDCED